MHESLQNSQQRVREQEQRLLEQQQRLLEREQRIQELYDQIDALVARSLSDLRAAEEHQRLLQKQESLIETLRDTSVVPSSHLVTLIFTNLWPGRQESERELLYYISMVQATLHICMFDLTILWYVG